MTTPSRDGYYPWQQPGEPGDEKKARLHVFNSLTGTLTPFIPSGGATSNTVKWYICGPTVYDSAHVGHASNYVRFDIVRRILSDYFGYDVIVQMNVTDIDDKIIRESNKKGVGFENFARKFEGEFWKDLKDLRVREPDFITRVSDYVEETKEFVERVIENGFAYVANGSVYFDTGMFIDKGFCYAKVEPKSFGNKEKVLEGEGVLMDGDVEKDKKSVNDFVIWKKSKDGEPKWDSKWGLGRPGWHIECSAMAEAVLGKDIDIHAGGVDLRFPHHSNEIALSESYHKSDQWVNYWLHSGHLHIDGLKMSKSLKNFITIQSVLERFSARQLRIMLLKYRYSSPMNYDEEAMQEAVNLDRTFIDFFGTLKAAIRSAESLSDPKTKPSEEESGLAKQVEKTQANVAKALADDFDTPEAMRRLLELIGLCNSYLNSIEDDRYNVPVLTSVGRYVSKMFRIFGLTTGQASEIEYGGAAEAGSQSREALIGPVLSAFAEYRDAVRQSARKDAQNQVCKDILKLSDDVRDDVLPLLGIRLEDRGAEKSSTWKLEDSRSLLAEIRRKKDAEDEKRRAKEKREAERAEKELKELEKGRVAPLDMFRSGDYEGKYSAYNEEGIPTKNIDGSDVTKSAVKKLLKAKEKQEKLYQKFKKAVEEGRMAI